jgi:hypothetical protein
MRYKLHPKNILISLWFRKARFFSNSLKGGPANRRTRGTYKRKIHPPKKYIYLRKRREYLVTPLMDLVIQQHHFGFSSLKSLGHFMKRNVGKNTG